MFQRYNDKVKLVTNCETPYLSFDIFNKYENLKAGFSTRLGGVSRAHLWSLNLGFALGDYPDRVLENYDRISKAIGFEKEQIVATKQVHLADCMKVNVSDCGNGIIRENAFESADALITNEPGVVLTVYGADCVPIMMYEPVKKVIATAHAGWRGTVMNIVGNTISKMQEEFDCNPADIVAVIGPSICSDCYEIGPEVAAHFAECFAKPYEKTYNFGSGYKSQTILKAGEGEHSYANLWLANAVNLTYAGVRLQNISLSEMCTKCRQDLFYSHRGSNGRRGVMSGFIMMEA
jgi:hypothetical protein